MSPGPPSQTLWIGRFHSTCGNCGRAADPQEKKHEIVLGYGDQPPGCGVEWTQVGSSYMGPSAAEATKRMRPDLEFVDVLVEPA